MKPFLQMLAAYNRWSNERLYAAAAKLSREAFLDDHGAFFGSLSATLNHLLVTDRIWLRRLEGAGPVHLRLDEIVTDDLAALAEFRAAEDARLAAHVDGLDETALAAPMTYQPISRPIDITQPRASVLAHIFNHQTHHRGQATVMLTRSLGKADYLVLDMVVFQRETGIGMG